MNEREAYIALNMMEDVGPVTVRALAAELGSALAIFEADPARVCGIAGAGRGIARRIIEQRNSIRIDGELKKADKLGIRIVTPLDGEYPEALSHIHDPPLVFV